MAVHPFLLVLWIVLLLLMLLVGFCDRIRPCMPLRLIPLPLAVGCGLPPADSILDNMSRPRPTRV